MSDIELVISRTKTLEALLEQGLGAVGKGLHEKVTSVQAKLPESLVKKLRFVATLRNKLVHDSSYQKLDDRPAFERVCGEAEAELRALTAPPVGINKGCFGTLLLIAAGVTAVVRSLV
ncbi:MAG TPA: hypothetical protein VKE74_21715 [Gemmataceae bacterium]|nr:hypothetical protein [Gemmataceae bacterium]